MVLADLEARIRAAIAAEIRALNPDPTASVMAVLRESEVIAA